MSLFPSSEAYLEARKNLVGSERAYGVYGNSTGSLLDAEAGRIVETLKRWEEKNHHGVQTDGTGSEAGHKFIFGKPFISKSNLFAIASRAPKGGLLHCHFDAMLPPEDMLPDARVQENLFIKTDVSLTSPGFFTHALPQFTVLPLEKQIEMTESSNLFSKAYVPGNWMKYSTFREMFPAGEEAAEAWLAAKMILTTDRAYHPKQTVDGVWREFGRNVTILRTLLGYETAYRGQFRRMIWKFARDGISYAEIRVALNYKFTISSDDGNRQLSQDEMIQIFASTLDQELPKMKEEGLSFFGVKIIYACMRNSSREAMKWCMDNCISLKQKFPHLICGKF
jgi:adenosine deaminase CECR1